MHGSTRCPALASLPSRPPLAPRRMGVAALLAAFCVALWAPASGAGEMLLDVAPEHSRDGVYALSWSGGSEVVVEESRDPVFTEVREVYRGADAGTVLTGRRDGIYHYRVYPVDAASAAGSAGATVSVRVEHHPIGRALAFFAVGLGVFVATVVLVARGPEGGPSRSGAAGGSR